MNEQLLHNSETLAVVKSTAVQVALASQKVGALADSLQVWIPLGIVIVFGFCLLNLIKRKGL